MYLRFDDTNIITMHRQVLIEISVNLAYGINGNNLCINGNIDLFSQLELKLLKAVCSCLFLAVIGIISHDNYNDWVRFELEAKHDYAHKLTTALLDTKNDIEYKEIILDFIIQKYFFVTANNNAPAPFLQQLIDMKNDQEITLFKSVNTKNTELSKNLLHLLRTSGTVTTLYKINAIWGNAGLKKCMDTITEIIKTHQPNQDCVRFLRNNLEEYRIAYSDYDSFFESEILPELLDE